MIIGESPRPEKWKRILGLWDLRVSAVSLGGLLTLIEELQMQCLIHGTHFADICLVGTLDSMACKDSTLLSALNMEGIGTYYLCDTIAVLQDFLCASPYITWPALNEQGLVSHRYASTIFVQKFYCKNGFIPHLSCKAEFTQWAMRFVEHYVMPCMPVVVHLKNNPNEQGCSNADFNAWLAFFKTCYQQYDVMFIVIGNEEIDRRVRKLPNTLVARDFGSNLSRDLALIQTAFIFMGMASGPCNMALFSEIPYVIYKNPDHDAEQMALELGQDDRFPFATSLQKILRIFEAGENLMSEFAHLYIHANRRGRFATL